MTNSQGIEGVPVGAKVVKVGRPNAGETIVGYNGEPYCVKFEDWCNRNYAILQPDNPYNRFPHEVEEDIKKAGMERLGGDDYRDPKNGDIYWDDSDQWLVRSGRTWTLGPRIILKPKTKKVLVCEFPIENDGTALIMGQKVLAVNAAGANCRIETRPA